MNVQIILKCSLQEDMFTKITKIVAKKKTKTKKMLKAKQTKETDKKYCKVQKGMDFIDGMTDSWNNAANKYQKHIRW